MTLHISHNATRKAVIQTNHITGEHRVFYMGYVNGVLKVLSVFSQNLKAYKVTGYTGLREIERNLVNATPVFRDEQILLNGEPCEHLLGSM